MHVAVAELIGDLHYRVAVVVKDGVHHCEHVEVAADVGPQAGLLAQPVYPALHAAAAAAVSGLVIWLSYAVAIHLMQDS